MHRLLGLAFRAFVLASPEALAPGAPGAALALVLGRAGYRAFVDPLLASQQVGPKQPAGLIVGAGPHVASNMVVASQLVFGV